MSGCINLEIEILSFCLSNTLILTSIFSYIAVLLYFSKNVKL